MKRHEQNVKLKEQELHWRQLEQELELRQKELELQQRWQEQEALTEALRDNIAYQEVQLEIIKSLIKKYMLQGPV